MSKCLNWIVANEGFRSFAYMFKFNLSSNWTVWIGANQNKLYILFGFELVVIYLVSTFFFFNVLLYYTWILVKYNCYLASFNVNIDIERLIILCHAQRQGVFETMFEGSNYYSSSNGHLCDNDCCMLRTSLLIGQKKMYWPLVTG